jgi:hypothetical protein
MARIPEHEVERLKKEISVQDVRQIARSERLYRSEGNRETTGVGVGLQPEKRIRRTAEEELRIVEATLVSDRT